MKEIIKRINESRKKKRTYNKERKKDNKYIKSVFRKLRKGSYSVDLDGYYLGIDIYPNLFINNIYVYFGENQYLNWYNIDEKNDVGVYKVPNEGIRYLRDNLQRFLEAIEKKEG